jgi:TPR repeat protein
MCLFYDVCSHVRALRLARRSAAAGCAYGQFALGHAHQYGCGGAEEDYDEALRLYAAAAEQGLADAQ